MKISRPCVNFLIAPLTNFLLRTDMHYSTVAPKEARALRRAFINKFADKRLPQYRAVMGHGDTYGNTTHNGFIWEVLRPYTLISFERALSLLGSMSELYVTWDKKPSCTKENALKFPLLKLSGSELAKTLENDRDAFSSERSFLPLDVYVFDEELNFHVTITNQQIQGIGTVCITSRNDIGDTGISPLMSELIDITRFGEGSC